MHEYQWNGTLDRATLMDEMDIQFTVTFHVYIRSELRDRVENLFLRFPVKFVLPVLY